MIEAHELGAWFTWGSWAWIRVWAMLRVQPCWGRVLGPNWWFVAGATALWVAVLAGTQASTEAFVGWPGLFAWGMRALVEFAVGSVWGWLVAVPTYAVIGAATQTRNHLVGEAGGEALVILMVGLGLAFGFALDLHQLAFVSLVDSLRLVPLGSLSVFPQLGDPLDIALRAARNVMTLSLALVTPVLLAAAITDSVVHALGRAFAPNRDPTMLAASWLRLSVVLVALGASWLTFPHMWARAWA